LPCRRGHHFSFHPRSCIISRIAARYIVSAASRVGAAWQRVRRGTGGRGCEPRAGQMCHPRVAPVLYCRREGFAAAASVAGSSE
jgi:hypothetical protein